MLLVSQMGIKECPCPTGQQGAVLRAVLCIIIEQSAHQALSYPASPVIGVYKKVRNPIAIGFGAHTTYPANRSLILECAIETDGRIRVAQVFRQQLTPPRRLPDRLGFRVLPHPPN